MTTGKDTPAEVDATHPLKGIPKRDYKRLRRMFLDGLYQSYVSKGELDPAGKTDQQLALEFWKMAVAFSRDLKNAGKNLKLIVIYRDLLLPQARRFSRDGQEEIALLFYATWFEHWINGIMHAQAGKLNLDDRALSLLLRTSNLETKFRCFPVLLHLPKINEKHLAAILRCGSLRNDFVHYKYLADKKPSTSDKDDARKREAIAASQGAVRYLEQYERRHIFKGAKSKIRRLIA
jgi:hypothetical protein